MGLTFVPTPIGNLRDVTLRALETLRGAELIVAEDTRVTRRLLAAHGIEGKKLWTYHEHNADATTAAILERARDAPVACVTDAGTPGISDPGGELVAAARAAGVPVEVLPGPAAFVCAAVLSGFGLARFSFEGFVPRTAGARRHALGTALAAGGPSVWYESPHRIVATLEALAELAPDAPLFLVRELTKLHEQQIAGTAAQLLAALERPVRGEIALVLAGGSTIAETPADDEPEDIDDAIDALLAAGSSVAAIAKTLVRRGAGERQTLYARIGERKRARGDGTEPR